MWGHIQNGRRARGSNRVLLAVLLCVAVLGKILAPTGWMPVASQGGLTFMLCSGSGETPAWIDGSGRLHIGKQPGGEQRSDHGKSDHQKAKDICPYAALGAPVALPDLAAIALLDPARLPAASFVPAAVAVGRGLAAPPPPATGPPHSA